MDRRRRLDSDPRTPMAWQHRDNFMNGDYGDNEVAKQHGRFGAPSNSRYGEPPTPNSAHSRASRTPDHRRDARGSSSDRFSQQSTKRLTSGGGGRDARSQTGSRTSRSTPHRGYTRSQPSPTSTEEETGEETTETDSQAPQDPNQFQQPMYHPAYAFPMAPYPAQLQPQLMGPIAPPQLLMAPNGSIRSVQSVPMLATAASITGAPLSQTWDGEPCPVHHHPTLPSSGMPLAALYGMGHHPPTAISMGPSSVPPSIISGATTVRRARSIAEISNTGGVNYPMLSAPATPHFDTKSFHGSMHIPPAASLSHPGMIMRPPRMVLGENGTPSHLPMRDPKTKSPLPSKDGDYKDDKDIACCSGHFIVLWIILGIITFGILLGIVLKFTIA